MNNEMKQNDGLPSAPEEKDMVVLIKKMQQQLTFLEKKIDLLINKMEKPHGGDRPFSRPQRPFDRHRQGKSRHEGSHEGDFNQERHFQKRHSGEGRGFDQNKKPFYHKRKNREA